MRIDGWAWQYGGHSHEGWLPQGASLPLATPKLEVRVNLEIRAEVGGCLLLWELSDPEVRLPDTTLRAGDTWHDSVDAACASAEEVFGTPRALWKAQEAKVSNPALPPPPSRRG